MIPVTLIHGCRRLDVDLPAKPCVGEEIGGSPMLKVVRVQQWPARGGNVPAWAVPAGGRVQVWVAPCNPDLPAGYWEAAGWRHEGGCSCECGGTR